MAHAGSTKALNELTVFTQRSAIRRKRLIRLKKTLYQVPHFVERPVDVAAFFSGWGALDMRGCPHFIGDEIAQMVSITSCIHDHMPNA